MNKSITMEKINEIWFYEYSLTYKGITRTFISAVADYTKESAIRIGKRHAAVTAGMTLIGPVKFVREVTESAPKPDMKIKDLVFKEIVMSSPDDFQWAHHGEFGSITILDRMTGYGYGVRDVETGFRSPDRRFWLASGGFDIRNFPDLTVSEAIEKIKENANTCVAA